MASVLLIAVACATDLVSDIWIRPDAPDVAHAWDAWTTLLVLVGLFGFGASLFHKS